MFCMLIWNNIVCYLKCIFVRIFFKVQHTDKSFAFLETKWYNPHDFYMTYVIDINSITVGYLIFINENESYILSPKKNYQVLLKKCAKWLITISHDAWKNLPIRQVKFQSQLGKLFFFRPKQNTNPIYIILSLL